MVRVGGNGENGRMLGRKSGESNEKRSSQRIKGDKETGRMKDEKD